MSEMAFQIIEDVSANGFTACAVILTNWPVAA